MKLPDRGEATEAVGGRSSSNGSSERTGERTGLSALLKKVTRQLPASLSDLATTLGAGLTYSVANSDNESAAQNLDQWKKSLQRQASAGNIEHITPTKIDSPVQLAYPVMSPEEMTVRSLSLCLEKAPHNAEVGVLFDPQGNVASEPTLIRSTGFSALNEEIKTAVAGYDDFPVDRSTKAYTLEVEVKCDPNTCVSLEQLQN